MRMSAHRPRRSWPSGTPPNPALQPTGGGSTVLAGHRCCGRRRRLSYLFGGGGLRGVLSLFRRLLCGATVQERRERYAKSIDGHLPTPEQQRLLGRMAADAFVEIRARSREPDLVFALADAFHCLPAVMHEPGFSWSWLLIFLAALERDFPEVGRRYMAAFDAVVGFDAEPGAAADTAAV
jgi:hypothetical protein